MTSDPKPRHQRVGSPGTQRTDRLSYRASVTAVTVVAALCSVFATSVLLASSAFADDPPASPSISAGGAPLATATFVRVAKLTASDEGGANAFGIDVELSGTTAIIASDNPSGPALERYPYVFDRGASPSIWSEVDKLTTYNPGPMNTTLALDGDIAVIATAPEDAQVFERDPDSGLWLETTTLETGYNPATIVTVAMSGDTVVIGRPLVAPGGVSNAGAAFIFERDPVSGLWSDAIELVPSETGEEYRFGFAVGAAGDTVVVSAPRASNGGIERGAVFVFQRDAGGPGVWGEVDKLTASDAMDDHGLGSKVAISGDTIVTSSSIMAVYVFERAQEAGGQWAEVAKLTASDSPMHAFFGTSLALTPGRMVVGDWAQEAWSGAAYIFERTSEGDWIEVSKLRLSQPLPEDRFSFEVAIEGETILIGAPQNYINGGTPGAVYVYERALFADNFESGSTQAWSSSSIP